MNTVIFTSGNKMGEALPGVGFSFEPVALLSYLAFFIYAHCYVTHPLPPAYELLWFQAHSFLVHVVLELLL